METSTRRKPLQRIRERVSRVQEPARKIPPEPPTEQSGSQIVVSLVVGLSSDYKTGDYLTKGYKTK